MKKVENIEYVENLKLKRASFLLTSFIWSALSQLARTLSKWGVLESDQLEPRVISVGNIQVGGAGKTPLVAKIANEAAAQGLRVCILSRGYRGEWEDLGGVISPDEKHLNVVQCGDEAALLHDLCPKAWIGVGMNRVQQYRHVVDQAKQEMDLVILDDGFQNWKIQKDLEIVALTSKRWGDILFRDFKWTIKNADLLVWTKGEERPETGKNPVVQVKYQLIPASTPVWLVTGLADGQSAFTLARDSGYTILKHVSYPDHANYDRNTIRDLLVKAHSADCKIALTGKDWVKWRDLGVAPTEVIVLEPELVITEGKELWSKVLWGN